MIRNTLLVLLLLLQILLHPSLSLLQSSLLSSGSWWRSPPPMAHSFYPPCHWRLWILLATTLSTGTFRHLCQLLLEWYGIWQAHRIRIDPSTDHSSLFSCRYNKQPPRCLPYMANLCFVCFGDSDGFPQTCCDREMLERHRRRQCGNGAMSICYNTHTSMIASMNVREDEWMDFRTCACMCVTDAWIHVKKNDQIYTPLMTKTKYYMSISICQKMQIWSNMKTRMGHISI